jgi:hypothetical protein
MGMFLFCDTIMLALLATDATISCSFGSQYWPVLSPFHDRACIIKLITAVIYGLRNELECLSLNTRLGWKGLPGTNTQAYYENRKLRPY